MHRRETPFLNIEICPSYSTYNLKLEMNDINLYLKHIFIFKHKCHSTKIYAILCSDENSLN